MVGPRDRRAERLFELRLVREPRSHLRGRAVEDFQERDLVLHGIVRWLGLGEQVLGEEVVDRLGLGGLVAGLGFGGDRLVSLFVGQGTLFGFRVAGPLGVDLGDSFAIGTLAFSDASAVSLPHAPRGTDDPGEEREQDKTRGDYLAFVPLDEFFQAVSAAGRAGLDDLVGEIALDVAGEAVGRLVAPGAVFLERLHHDPVELALQ